MPKFLMAWILGLGGAAIGLLLCWLLFGDTFNFDGFKGFVLALVVFAILNAIIPIFVLKLLVRHADSVVALTGLISAFLALFITALTPWMNITGFWTWVGSVVILWVLGMFIWVIPGPWRNSRKVRAA